MISRYENPDYGKYSVSTLLELADAFDVALIVHFAPFSELVDWDMTRSSETLNPVSFDEDEGLWGEGLTSTTAMLLDPENSPSGQELEPDDGLETLGLATSGTQEELISAGTTIQEAAA